jgi:hypothetical protein
MKNYVVVFGVPVTTSFFAPKTIGGVTPDEAQVLTDQYLAADPGATQDGPPARFYWLLNKRVVSALYVSQTDSFDPFNNPQFTQDTKLAKDYGVETQLPNLGAWGGTDTADPQQVKAAKIADERSAEPKQSDVAGAADLITNFFALCDAITAGLKANKQLDKLFRTRQLNLVKQVRDEVSSGILSITDALQELINDGLVT